MSEVSQQERVFTNGEMRTFKTCRRQWWLGWYRKLRPTARKVVGPAPLGTWVHTCLEDMYAKGADPLSTLGVLYANDWELVQDNPDAQGALQKQYELAYAMLEGYVEWLAETGADQGLQVVEVEARIRVPSGIEGVDLMGKLDQRLLREIDQARLFLDHKTVASINDATKRLHMDEQMLHYHVLERILLQILGENTFTDGAIYNMLRKVKRTARATPPFYERYEVRHNPAELASYWQRMHGVIRDILAIERELEAGVSPSYVVYPTPTKDCSWRCEFFAVCPMIDDGSAAEPMLEALYEPANPLDRYDKKGDDDG